MNPISTTLRQIVIEPTFEAWRDHARTLLLAGVRPEDVSLAGTEAATLALFASGEPPSAQVPQPTIFVPKSFVERARILACHQDPQRWNLLYRVLWRLQSDRNLLQLEVDDDVALFRKLENQVRRDLHKMHAFVRFRKVEAQDAQDHYIAWYRPDHSILKLAAPFFSERFAVMQWSILTPGGSMAWDPGTATMTYGPGVPRTAAPEADELESLWKTYYSSIFNPARLNTRAMKSEMPVRYWKNLPEIDILPQLLTQAEGRVTTMIERQSKATATPYVPADHSLPVLSAAIPKCKGCDLYEHATQAVFGAGPTQARIVLVGEQPGEEEDRRGQPFVGPAGRVLNEVLDELSIDRSLLYVTNAVKHFKFTLRGKRRIHDSPRLSEIVACRPWLLAELDALQPRVVVCLGATASKSLLGNKFALMKERGKVIASEYAPQVIATLHPSAILRATDPARGAEMRVMLRADLQLAHKLAA